VVIRLAERTGTDVGDVPLTAVAAEAGISRSTLLRRLGGSRQALDDAVRKAGVDPGGRQPVRTRGVEAAALLISERGLAAVTLEAVADKARCSVHSLYVTFGGRDGLLAATYEAYSPISDIGLLTARGGRSFEQTVLDIYRLLFAALDREPRVAPGMLADLISRPTGPAGRIFQRYFPPALDSIGAWLMEQMRAGRIRPLPLPLLVQQLMGPVMMHLLLRPAFAEGLEAHLDDAEATCAVFAEAFVRAVAATEEPAHSAVLRAGDDSGTDDRRV